MENQLGDMTRPERRNFLKCKIREKFKNKSWNSEIAVYRSLPKEYQDYMSEKCFYKYLQDMGCHKTHGGKYVFRDSVKKDCFNKVLKYKTYNRYITFLIKTPTLTPFLVQNINRIAPDDTHNIMQKDFHCIGVHDLLICFYTLYEDQDEEDRTKEIIDLITLNFISNFRLSA